ncbi:hypothetical protein C2845_PM05G17050 [Panicum miliaceum]|uniref:DUF4220 domain-containing protein n=1 Tax=Panicum miliaceum TaxID=4540 RepID=A0A3L6T1P4_PANMI|nr:hypothetical protein C2845_PM05G17050 [Panicum miliaceum]
MVTVGKQTVNCDDDPDQIYDKMQRAIIQVEVFMAAAAVLLFFQLVCGSLRRRSNNAFIQGGLWVSYTLLPPLVTYTLGLMQSSQVTLVIMYPVWALSLFLIAGGANSITAYDLDDNRQWKRGVFDILQYDIYFGIVLFQLLYPSSTGHPRVESTPMSILYRRKGRQFLLHPTSLPFFILFAAVCFSHTFRTIASWMVNHSYPSKVLADYMKDYAAAAMAANSRLGGGDHSKEDSFDPVTMKGCKYMVHWPAYKVTGTWNGKSSLYRCEPVPKEGVVTVGMIWDERNEEKLVSHGLSSSRIKGACLSYSLSHLLMRHFFGMDCAEASLPETRRFVLEGLLSENSASDEYTEAFRVIEVELAFLYDFFYTRYALIFGMEGLFFLMVIVKIVCSFGLGAVMLYASLSERRARFINDEYYFIIIGPNVTRVSVTVAIIGAFLVVEALQFILYLGSDWAMVSLACSFLTGRGNPDGFIPLALRKRFDFLVSKRRLPLFGYWQNKLGQYSVVEGSKFFSLRKDFAFESSTLSAFIFSKTIAYLGQSLGNLFSSKGLHFVKLPDKLKPRIVSILKSSSDGHLTNGKASLQRNGFLQQFSWTLQNGTQTESMLIWHIATDYCRIICDNEDLRSRQLACYDNHEVATKLSCYCAYLMSNIPKLLPGNSFDTRSIFDEAMYKAREALGANARDRDALYKALSCSGVDNSILTKGLKLGTELEAIEDTSLRWKVMAEFWAEIILYIAPSDNAKAHMERLAQGGEFLTHLWALLTHAGILNRDQEPNLEEGEGLA